ncbi:TrkA family potassium uptake protein [Halalkalicoccus tibetensis]|uniref:TrkA family potassium uptake protein n=1 Tax=Halalkalicoccus tibetensis TaxID=175632 RepID=A0ABD5V6U6_9EURY
MYLIIVGAGKIGSNLIDMAVNDGNDVVVIERDEARAQAVSRRHDCLVLNTDATTNGALRDADVDRADAVISTTNIDAVNIMVMLLAQEHGVPSLVSVVHDPEHLPVFEKIGVNLMETPQRLIADHLYHSVRYPDVHDFIELEDGTELIELTVSENADMAGRSLNAAKEGDVLPDGCLVVALSRDGDVRAPQGNTVIQADDQVTVFTDDATLRGAVTAFTGDYP